MRLRPIALLPRLRCALHTSSATATEPARRPNPALELDPALQALLQDTDLSLLRTRGRRVDSAHGRVHKVLEIVNDELNVPGVEAEGATAAVEEEAGLFPRGERKSPAASFGSRSIGAVVLPFELQRSILRLISESDKPLMHADAVRLFQDDNEAEDAWSTRYAPPAYTSPSATTRMAHIKARLARNRDGTAFASVVMPAQYAVAAAVLANVVTRLGPEWARGVDRVIEWGSGTGAGMWAALHTFRYPVDADATLATSHIAEYIGIEKRDGLATIARRLLRDIPLGDTAISLHKSLRPSDRVPRIAGLGTVALSLFTLSTLATPSLHHQMLREMWDSGADVLVIVDDASTQGFRHVADAREFLLALGQRELAAVHTSDIDPATDGRGRRGAHIVAPCPHDISCPLLSATASGVRCTFEQKLQRPAFVRRTKHAGAGEEDVGYAYVVVRRGERPGTTGAKGVWGRVGAVGRWEEEAARKKEEEANRLAMWEDVIDDHAVAADEVTHVEHVNTISVVSEAIADEVQRKTIEATPQGATAPASPALDPPTDESLESLLRLEAYSWPRINFPPLKRSGHILIDACMPSGAEMRLTFPRSQGKQVYYDARKSAWGDLFPHVSKHRPVPRYVGPGTGAGKREKGRGVGRGGEGALANVGIKAAGRARWGGVADALKEDVKRRRRQRKLERGAKEMGTDEE